MRWESLIRLIFASVSLRRCDGRPVAASGGGPIRRCGEHGRPLGPAISGHRQRGAGADGRAQAEGDPRRPSRLSSEARRRRRVHAAWAGARTRRTRAQGRLSLGVELRPRREAQLQKKASWPANATVPTWRVDASSGQAVRTRLIPSVSSSSMRPGRKPTWSRFGDGRRAEKGWWPKFPTATGKP